MISDELRRWLRGVAPTVAGRALLGLGLRPEELGAARELIEIGRPPIVRWSLDEDALRHRTAVRPEKMAAWLPEGLRGLRIAIDTPAPPEGIARRLLRVDGVASAFVMVERPEGLLRPRPWGWPLRVGLAGFPEGAAETMTARIKKGHDVVPRMVTVRRLEDAPGAVDVVVLRGPLLDAVAYLVRLRAVANLVLVVDEPLEPPRVVEAQLATLRAATGARASALAAPKDLAGLLRELTRQLSHAKPLDTALTIAAKNDVLLLADPGAVAGPPLRGVARQSATTARRARYVLRDVDPRLQNIESQLDIAATGAFWRESHEASTILHLQDEVEPRLAAHDEPRWCQAVVGDAGDNVLRPGPNRVSFFIGPAVVGALAAPAPLRDDLPWEEEGADSFRLTVLFVPTGARTAQQVELDLPRFGSSRAVELTLDVRKGSRAAARFIVLFRNRVLQTAMLTGKDGEAARLVDVVALVPTLTDLDRHRPFDAALVANCQDGTGTVTGIVAGEAYVTEGGSIPAITDRIVGLLKGAGALRPGAAGLAAKGPTTKLIDLAVEGHDLHDSIAAQLRRLGDAARIQIVSLNGAWLLPLELVYARDAPDDDAKICPNFLADPASCTGDCPTDPLKFLCPNAFWGISKTIERHRADPDDPSAVVHRLLAVDEPPQPQERSITRALLGASDRVDAADLEPLLAALGEGAGPAASWEAWEQALARQDTGLLVLLPHTDYTKATLEIAHDRLRRGRIGRRYVTGNREVRPIVILLGCRTTGTDHDPGGFAARFKEDASAVFHSLADLRAGQATDLALRLTNALASSAGRTIDELLTELRRQAVRDGLLTGLSITAFGDVDQKV
jgi:hypothetical protein